MIAPRKSQKTNNMVTAAQKTEAVNRKTMAGILNELFQGRFT